jgi:hypothetical protein
MGGQPLEVDWELVIGSSLVPHLLPGGLRGVRRPADVGWLPDGAYPAIVDSVGHVSLEDLLVVPAATWPVEPWRRRRRLYSPLCVMAIGARGVGLWVQALPAPGVRAWVPLEEIASVEQRADGPYGVLVVTGRAATLFVRYDDDGQAVVAAWTRRLRRRVAAVSAPIPPQPASRGPHRDADPGSLLLVPGDAIVSAGWRSRAGRGTCLLSVTSRELVIVQSARGLAPPWRRATSTLCLPRGPVEDAAVRSRTMLLRSAGTEVCVSLRSRTVAAAASSWLRWMLSGHGRVRAADRGDGKPQ